jgi:DNA-directed RNA polymerase specialized sigma24 family protein
VEVTPEVTAAVQEVGAATERLADAESARETAARDRADALMRLRGMGVTSAQIAELCGLTTQAVDQAVYRRRKSGLK